MTNPFSTCRVRPGRLAFRFAEPAGGRQLVDRLRAGGWRGQIVGPHGVGKSTLLHSLMPELVAAGRTISWWTLQRGRSGWPAAMRQAAQAWDARTLVVVDGCEQLPWFARRRLKARCRSAGAGLLVTSHRDVGLPLLMALDCPLRTVQELVAHLLADDPIVIRPDEVSSCFRAHRGNVREVFFALYDLYEARRRGLEERPGLPGLPDYSA